MSQVRMDRICIIMTSAIGDAVHVLPLVNALKRHQPSSHITWVLQPGPASLVRGHPAVDDVILFRRRDGWRAFVALRRAFAERQPFDAVLDLQVSFKAGIMTALAPAPVKLGFDRRRARDLTWLFTNRRLPPQPQRHIQDQFLEFLDELGVPAEPLEWQLGPWPGEPPSELMAGIDRPIASLVIATSNPEKDWVPERWAEVVDHLYEHCGMQPVLAGGRSDRELETEAAICQRARSPVVSTLGCPLRELVAILHASTLVISLDTGPMHMAVALGRPVIALIGYSDPRRIGPYRASTDLIIDAFGTSDTPITQAHRRGRMQTIAAADVIAKIARRRGE
ncbi:MAG: glycosyltransferase family 9 protein [Gemmatimonadota bacterium]